MFSIGKKLNFFIAGLLLLIAAVIIIFNTYSYHSGMREQLVDRQLPAMADGILGKLDNKILEPSRALGLIVKNPLLQDWIRKGEPNEEGLESTYRLLQSFIDTYGTIGANFVSQGTKQYTDIQNGKRDNSYRVDEAKDGWFTGFRDSGVDLNIVVYVNDPTWGTKAFINRRVTVDGKYAGMTSASVDLKDFARDLSSMTLGKEGKTFIVDDKGHVRLTADTAQLNKPLASVFPAYAAFWDKVAGAESYQTSYDDGNGVRYVIARKIPVLNWYLCTEASGPEFMRGVRSSIVTSVIISLLMVAAGCVAGLLFVRGITTPLKTTVDFATEVSRGRLDVSLAVGGKDEIGLLADALRNMVDSLRQKISQANEQSAKTQEQMLMAERAMRESEDQKNKITAILDAIHKGTEEAGGISEVLSKASRRLGEESSRVTKGAESQYASLQDTNQAIATMVSGFNEIMRGTDEAAKRVESARQKALEGAQSVSDVIGANARVNTVADSMQRSMRTLESQAEGINRILDTITDIADQTNLLALNAAIEAARAGDAGRGFAVVADEVRKLAEKTMLATKDVSAAITSVQNSAKDNLRAMEETHAAVQNATELARASGEALTSIVALSDDNAGQVNSIAGSVADLVRHSDGITGSLQKVNGIAQETIHGMENSAGSIKELIAQATRLDQIILTLREKGKL